MTDVVSIFGGLDFLEYLVDEKQCSCWCNCSLHCL